MQQQQYLKFEYKEFVNRDQYIVNTSDNSENKDELEKERLINEVIAEHFHESEVLSDSPVEESLETEHVLEDVVDIEQIKADSYKDGYDAATAALEPQLQIIKSENEFDALLRQQLEALGAPVDVDHRMFELSSTILSLMAKKLHLVLPADFDAIILGEMMPILSKYYKDGAIILRVHPDRVDYCNNLFKIGSLPERIAKNASIVADDTIATNGCSIEWHDTLLKYNQEELVLDIEKILENLKIKLITD